MLAFALVEKGGEERAIVRFSKDGEKLTIWVVREEAVTRAYATLADEVKKLIYISGTVEVAEARKFSRYVGA